MNLQELRKKVYSSKFYERFITFQGKTVSKWQTQLLKIPLYWRWHGLKYNNAVHWLVLLSFTAGMFFGVMSPFTASRQPGRGQEPEAQAISNGNSTIVAHPALLAADGYDTAEIEIVLLDENLNPIKNRGVEFVITGEGASFTQNEATTSVNGIAYSYLTAETPGIKTISVKDVATGLFLERTMTVEFSENSVKHWVKPGDIDLEAATSIALETAGTADQWQTDAVLSTAKVEEIGEKRSVTGDSCLLIGREVFCAGGKDSKGNQTSEFYKINLETNERTELTSLPYPIADHKIARLGQAIYLFGGTIGTEPIETVYKYSLESNTWEHISDLPQSLSNFDIAVHREELFIIGGYGGETQSTSVYKFDGESWSVMPDMRTKRNFSNSVIANGVLYTFGGWDGEKVISSSEKYLIGGTQWESIASLPTARWGHLAAEFENNIYLLGGYNSNSQPISSIDIYNPKTDSWSQGELTFGAGNASFAETDDGILIIGGDANPTGIFKFMPQRNSITITQNENLRRADRPSTQINVVDESATGKIFERNVDSLDLSTTNSAKLLLYSSKAGNIVNFLFGEDSVSENEIPIILEKTYLWEEITIDLSRIPEAKRSDISYLGFEIADASEPFQLNIYDIWTEQEFFPNCPCTREIEDILFTKESNQAWGKMQWAAKETVTSSTLISYRTASSEGTLKDETWKILSTPEDLIGDENSFLGLKVELRDEKEPGMPELRAVSVEITEK